MQITAEQEKAAGHITSRLRWLMFSRVVIISFLLALTAFVELKGTESFPEISSSLLFRTILLAYILSIFYLIMPRRVGSIPVNIYIQSLGDTLLITVMVYATGGISSNYSTFYPLVIIYSVLFLGRRGGLIIASATGICYGLLAHLEFYRVIDPHFFREAAQGYQISIGDLYARILVHILSFYVVAFLASFVVEQERRIRTLLAERQSAFDQLDLLHRSIIESVDNGILTIDQDGRIKSFNRAAAEITSLTFRDIENRQLGEIFPEICPSEGLRAEHARGSMVKRHFEMVFAGKQGNRMVLGGSVSPLRDTKGVMIGHIVIFQDLTAITEMRESLDKSRRLALIGEMAANLAHEIRNPLAAISGSIQMLRGEVAQNETNARLMKIILRGKDHLEGFLKDFLWMARPAMGAEEELDIRETISDISESLRCVADWHERLKVVLLLTDKPLAIRANKTEVRQIFWNLMLNAVQAMPEGGVLKVEARHAANGSTAGTEVRIGDTGCGIAESELTKIFDPFYTTRDRGTGLGLAVVNRIINAYGGRLQMESEHGKGSVFTVWLPARRAEAPAAGHEREGRGNGQDPRVG